MFKYSGFFIENINTFLHTSISNPNFKLPIGISFYTFQTLSYTIDMYRGKTRVQKSFLGFLAYVSMFPQLVAGPIVRYAEIAPQLDSRQTTLEDVNNAIKAMQSAKTARDISRADQQLTVAVSQLVDDANLTSAEDEPMLTRAADTFAEQGSFLRQEARSYNQKAEKAEKLYEKLPTKFLLAQQDMYEGI